MPTCNLYIYGQSERLKGTEGEGKIEFLLINMILISTDRIILIVKFYQTKAASFCKECHASNYF